MALQSAGVASVLSSLVPRFLRSTQPLQIRISTSVVRIQTQLWPSAALSLPVLSLNIPGVLSDIWEGVLRAVPKKKTSHMKKRHRQLAGKALKDVQSINSCPACGKPKRAHLLCPYCVEDVRKAWKEATKTTKKDV